MHTTRSDTASPPNSRRAARKPAGGRALLLALVMAVGLTAAWASDPEGHGPDAWRVTGVAAGHVLNARMGPGTDYAVIAHFEAGERGLTQTTCVPFVPVSVWMGLSDTEQRALPPRWCLMRSADLQRAGWVAQRYIAEDTDPTAPSPAATESGDDIPATRKP